MGKRKNTPSRPLDLQTYSLTKIDIAEAHLKTAITLYFEDSHPVPVYHLAAAAREIITTLANFKEVNTVLHDLANKREVKLETLIKEIHKFARFFKHADRDANKTIEFNEGDVDMVLQVACHDFGRVAGGMPVEAQVFEAYIHAIAYERVSDAPLRKQKLLKKVIQAFYGIRTASRRDQKKIALSFLRKALTDPSFKMEYSRKVATKGNQNPQ
jgi:hypothetical protein